jgi:hypothetical protein
MIKYFSKYFALHSRITASKHLDISLVLAYPCTMRTTLKIDDEILRVARSMAAERGKTVGEVISELALRGLRPSVPRVARGGFPVFDVSREAAPMTPEMVRKALEE